MIWEDSENLNVHNDKSLFHDQAYFYDDIVGDKILLSQIEFNSDKVKVGLGVTITNSGIITAKQFIGVVTSISGFNAAGGATAGMYYDLTSSSQELRFQGSLLPTFNNLFDLGSAQYKVRDVFEDQGSDERIKEDIVPFTGALNFVNQIPVVSFTFKDIDYNEHTRGKRETGFIAQDVKKALDNSDYESYRLWSENPESYQGLDKKQMIPALTAAIQELSKKVDAIEERLDKLT